jgi:hypothetical protein
MLEKNFKKKIQDEMKVDGWIFIQLVAGAGIPRGFPDTLCLSPTGYSCYVEWKKSSTAKHQPLQGWWIDKLNNMGHEAQFVSPENVEDWRDRTIKKSQIQR